MPVNSRNNDVKIMIVEDETIIAKDVENILLNYGFKVVGTFGNAEDAVANAIELQPDLILMDIVLRGNYDGIEAAKKIIDKIQVPIIYLTAYADEKTINRIIDTVPYGYFLKPFQEKELFTWIQTTLHKFKIDRELRNKLMKSERDIRQIEYIASHDLQEPLRMIASYVRLLQKRYHGKLDKEADEFIDFAVDGVNRMKDMVNNILEFARINQENFKPEIVDLRPMIEEIRNDLESEFGNKTFNLSYGNLPTVTADREHLRLIFYNLLNNSIKFNNSDICRIKIECMHENKSLLFKISDNGIGIDNQYSDKIFELFQKLHENDKYTGTGMGLAICRKIVEFYMGELWFDSTPGKGTTFNFTIKIDGRYSTN